MAAALPPRFGFVIKREMNDVPVAGLLLRRIGSEFVERFNRHKGGTDARRVLRTAASGHRWCSFPKARSRPRPGLGKFHTGAFAIAARAGCPVVPAVILGTRRNMPATRVLPRPGPHRSELRRSRSSPVTPSAAGGDDPALTLRDRSRAAILERVRRAGSLPEQRDRHATASSATCAAVLAADFVQRARDLPERAHLHASPSAPRTHCRPTRRPAAAAAAPRRRAPHCAPGTHAPPRPDPASLLRSSGSARRARVRFGVALVEERVHADDRQRAVVLARLVVQLSSWILPRWYIVSIAPSTPPRSESDSNSL